MDNKYYDLKPEYSNSRALIIGIDQYEKAPPLSYAVNDAREIAAIIIKEFGFLEKDVTVLLDRQATKENIMDAYMAYTTDCIDNDERIFIFYAGHGHTKTGVRGEVGFLVPYDASVDAPVSLIRWDELTRNAELIQAKHVFFIMDACYGGLAIMRGTAAGSARFKKDMLLRFSRQVLTAGKADEVVSDSGGPLPYHSVFTGHLIEAFKGKAELEQGIITANSVMAYVYEKVAIDSNSNQTPHYGFLDGDGDFIFKFPTLEELTKDNERDIDELIIIPFAEEDISEDDPANKIANVKRLLADSTASIELHDFSTREIQRFLSLSSEDSFEVNGVGFSQEELLGRLSRYESLIGDLAGVTACVAYWAKPEHKITLQKLVSRVTDRLDSSTGLTVWLNLRWYPIIIQVYSAGVSAVAGRRYDSLADIFYANTGAPSHGSDDTGLLISSVGEAIFALSRQEVFKQIPGHERHYVPMSEYLYKLIQPSLDDILFIGKDYEAAFDEFEVMLGLAVADQRAQRSLGSNGPIGRFGWKHFNRSNPPLQKIISVAHLDGEGWEPIKQGMFGGSYERFISVADIYLEHVSRLQWF